MSLEGNVHVEKMPLSPEMETKLFAIPITPQMDKITKQRKADKLISTLHLRKNVIFK